MARRPKFASAVNPGKMIHIADTPVNCAVYLEVDRANANPNLPNDDLVHLHIAIPLKALMELDTITVQGIKQVKKL